MIGYSIAKNYTLLTIWKFGDRTRALVSTAYTKPTSKRNRRERYDILSVTLREHGLPIPEFIEIVANGQKSLATVEDREAWIRANLESFPDPETISDEDKRKIIGAMKSAGLYAKTTYFKDAWQLVRKVIEKVRSESK